MMHNTGMTPGATGTAPGALSISGPQPVWMILNEARERAFTGEIVFEVDPEVLAYFDAGIVYYAERATDVSLGQRLMDAGVLDHEQLIRGIVRVGEVEHLGRLFDREPSVDRDAVLVLTETSTEDIIADLANREVATIRATAYRHHPSGLHRWFVVPMERGPVSGPVSEFGALGTPSVEDMPPLTLFEDDAELSIEWDEPFDGLDLDVASYVSADDFMSDAEVIEMAFAELDEPEFFDTDPAPELDELLEAITSSAPTWESEAVSDDEHEQASETASADTFSIVWPDGTEVPTEPTEVDMTLATTPPAEDLAEETSTSEATVDRDTDVWSLADEPAAVDFEPIVPVEPIVAVEPVDMDDAWVLYEDSFDDVAEVLLTEAPVDDDLDELDDVDDQWASADVLDAGPSLPPVGEPLVYTSHYEVHLDMPQLDDDVDPATARDEVPDDVAEAVRRAIAAIESVTADPAAAPDTSTSLSGFPSGFDTPAEMPAPASAFGGFAPPTIATSAEVIYARIEAGEINEIQDVLADVAPATELVTQPPVFDESALDVVGEAATLEAGDDVVSEGVAPIVFVDEPVADFGNGDQRKSALKRLIGSLRRRDR